MLLLSLSAEQSDVFWLLRHALLDELRELPGEQDTLKLEEASRAYFLSHTGRDLFTWAIFEEEQPAACGSLCLFNRLPYPGNPEGKEGYILNIYTRPEFRGKGCAGKILAEIFRFAKQNGLKRLWLSASEAGKPLYRRLGFTDRGNEMELFL